MMPVKMSKIIKRGEIKKDQFLALNIHSELFAASSEDPLEHPVFIPMAILPRHEENDDVAMVAACEIQQEQKVQAEEDLAQRVQEAYEQGYSEGISLAEGRLKDAADLLASAAAEIANSKRALLRQDGDVFWRIISATCETILRKTIPQHPEILVETIKNAFTALSSEGAVVIRVNPADYDLLTSIPQGAGVFDTDLLSIKTDDTVSRGGCIAESELGAIDAQIESQMEEVRRSIGEIDFLANAEPQE